MTIGILFVCTGNTCRSPMAVGTLRSIVRRAGIEHLFEIGSAGTGNRHVGQPPSLPAIEAAARRGYDISDQRTRRLAAADIEHFAYPLAMDRTHLAAMRSLAPSGFADRPQMFLKYAPALGVRDIVDPYGGTVDDYERALDLIEAGCAGLLQHLRSTLERTAKGPTPA
ncbi:MAG: low molecular weight protein-tyrosine-phosphatase [Reyranella sp.]|uniref:low molecular weight protein-tyrosine-phosphatase n=1 Tax=Reyranella sp. TaxID=1929291 RepID=UPI0027314905|nr:low molecular weight protein-tyrosine-phosphatase [Reyranella sp.]MDP1964668.1 low molecular weight protein-tyrosine-phosphatase [Reyranella sp.]MDP2376743.1 low molecular weight protein-tyrosine-phosphatase [Reyranella sp.]